MTRHIILILLSLAALTVITESTYDCGKSDELANLLNQANRKKRSISPRSSSVGAVPLSTYPKDLRDFVKKYIINGQDAPSGKTFPWQGSLQIFTFHICGAVLISENWALTAAHCVLPQYINDYYITFGDIDIGGYKQKRKILGEHFKVHPKYNANFRDDIAAIKLDPPVTFSSCVQPACLPDKMDHKLKGGETCVNSGWGLTNPNDNFLPRYLQYGIMPIASQSDCVHDYQLKNVVEPGQGTKQGTIIIANQHRCFGTKQPGDPVSCNGDSGGPFVCPANDDGKTRFYLQGLVSFGYLGCPVEYYTVATNVLAFMKFIEDTTGIGPNGSGYPGL